MSRIDPWNAFFVVVFTGFLIIDIGNKSYGSATLNAGLVVYNFIRMFQVEE